MNIRKKWATFKGDVAKWRKLRKNKVWRNQKHYFTYRETLPIDEKSILLETQFGSNIEGNIFHLARYLSSAPEFADYTVTIALHVSFWPRYRQMMKQAGISRVKLVNYGNEIYFQRLATAKYLFADHTFIPCFMKRPGQVYVNLWHGTPLKSMGRSMEVGFEGIGNVQRNFCQADYLMYPNEYTREVMIRDYMLENVASGSSFLCGYPRTSALLDEGVRSRQRKKMGVEGKRVYAYMPTFRGVYKANDLAGMKDHYRVTAHLLEIERRLNDDEVLYVNLHPACAQALRRELFTRIRFFDKETDTYQFLSAADVLITDYSSVFFDFAATRRKVVLFPYDKDEYLAFRGTYIDLDELPFPQVFAVPELVEELRSPKNYDDEAFVKRFNAYDGPDAAARICNATILGKWDGVPVEKIKSNGKDNVLLFMGMIAQNGITGAMLNLLSGLDLTKRNYCVAYEPSLIKGSEFILKQLPPGVIYYGRTGDVPLTQKGKFFRYLWRKLRFPTSWYYSMFGKSIALDFQRLYGPFGFKSVVHYEGYHKEGLMCLMKAPVPKTVVVHSDMRREIKARGTARADVLELAYNGYDKVVAVSCSARDSARTFVKDGDRVVEIPNVIPQSRISERAQSEIDWHVSSTSVAVGELARWLAGSDYKFVSVGRFSVEKGHERLVRAFAKVHAETAATKLVIVGGSYKPDVFARLKKTIAELGLSDCVALVLGMKNPLPLVKACDGFVLSSFYEGLPLVISEAQICGKPVVSTDIPSVRAFLDEYGGLTVAQSEEGLADGMRRLLAGKVPFRPVDYTERNRRAIADFEALLS